jgi:glycosyltransferase involved in cell wall biosynthesis
LDRVFESFSLKTANEVICAYEFPKEYVKKYRHTEIPTIYNRVDTDRFRPVERLRTRGTTVIHVGRLVFEKSPESLIKAIEDLPVKLVLVGNGELRGYLNHLANRLQLDGKVQFAYHLDHEAIHRLYAKADIFVMCMKIGGVSIPMLEAMASGLPIVFTRGIYERRKEVVEDIGMCVQDNPKDIARAISLLISDQRLREHLGRKARERILRLSGEKMERLEATLYRRLAR